MLPNNISAIAASIPMASNPRFNLTILINHLPASGIMYGCSIGPISITLSKAGSCFNDLNSNLIY